MCVYIFVYRELLCTRTCNYSLLHSEYISSRSTDVCESASFRRVMCANVSNGPMTLFHRGAGCLAGWKKLTRSVNRFYIYLEFCRTTFGGAWIWGEAAGCPGDIAAGALWRHGHPSARRTPAALAVGIPGGGGQTRTAPRNGGARGQPRERSLPAAHFSPADSTVTQLTSLNGGGCACTTCEHDIFVLSGGCVFQPASTASLGRPLCGYGCHVHYPLPSLPVWWTYMLMVVLGRTQVSCLDELCFSSSFWTSRSKTLPTCAAVLVLIMDWWIGKLRLAKENYWFGMRKSRNHIEIVLSFDM